MMPSDAAVYLYCHTPRLPMCLSTCHGHSMHYPVVQSASCATRALGTGCITQSCMVYNCFAQAFPILTYLLLFGFRSLSDPSTTCVPSLHNEQVQRNDSISPGYGRPTNELIDRMGVSLSVCSTEKPVWPGGGYL